MTSQVASGRVGSGGPFGFCDICGGRQHNSRVCPSLVPPITGPLCFWCGLEGHFLSQCKGQRAPTCYTCRGVGHFKDVCKPDVVSSMVEYKAFTRSHCFWCGGAGHYVAWCSSKSTTGMPLCFKCGADSHTETQCTSLINAPKCGMCHGVGHLEKDCNNIAYYVVSSCEKCKSEGHEDRDCPKKSKGEYPAWKGYNFCATCKKEGHFTGACGNYIAR